MDQWVEGWTKRGREVVRNGGKEGGRGEGKED